MTRKRFIKLLMSWERDRNYAQYWANKTMKSGYPYQLVYDKFLSNHEEAFGHVALFEMPLAK